MLIYTILITGSTYGISPKANEHEQDRDERRFAVFFVSFKFHRGNFKSKSAARRPETLKMALFLGEKALRQT
jgi:hypothetical protein